MIQPLGFQAAMFVVVALKSSTVVNGALSAMTDSMMLQHRLFAGLLALHQALQFRTLEAVLGRFGWMKLIALVQIAMRILFLIVSTAV